MTPGASPTTGEMGETWPVIRSEVSAYFWRSDTIWRSRQEICG